MPAESSVPVLVSNRAVQYSDRFNSSLIPYAPPRIRAYFIHLSGDPRSQGATAKGSQRQGQGGAGTRTESDN